MGKTEEKLLYSHKDVALSHSKAMATINNEKLWEGKGLVGRVMWLRTFPSEIYHDIKCIYRWNETLPKEQSKVSE